MISKNSSSVQLFSNTPITLQCNNIVQSYNTALHKFHPFTSKSITNFKNDITRHPTFDLKGIDQNSVKPRFLTQKMISLASVETNNTLQTEEYLIRVRKQIQKPLSSYTLRVKEQENFIEQLQSWNKADIPSIFRQKFKKSLNKQKQLTQEDQQNNKKSPSHYNSPGKTTVLNIRILKTEHLIKSPSKKQTNQNLYRLAKRVINTQKVLRKFPHYHNNHPNPKSDRTYFDIDDVEIIQGDVGYQKTKKCLPFINPQLSDDLVTLIYKVNQIFQNIVRESNNLFQFVIHNNSVEWLRVKEETLLQSELTFVQQQFAIKATLDDQLLTYEDLELDKLDSILSRLKFFNKFNKATRFNILKLCRFASFSAGEYIFRQGDQGDKLYVIVRGSVNVKVNKKNDEGFVEERVVAGIYDGQHFGELAIMVNNNQKNKETYHTKDFNIRSLLQVRKYLFAQELEEMNKYQRMIFGNALIELQKRNPHINIQDWLVKDNQNLVKFFDYASQTLKEDQNILINSGRQASIECIESTDCLTLDRQDFRNILMVLMQDDLDLKIQTLKKMQMFSYFESFALIPLANQLTEVTYQFDEIIIKEGQELDTFFIIKEGQAKAVKMCTVVREKEPHPMTKGLKSKLANFQFSKSLNRVQKPQPNNYKLGMKGMMTEYHLKQIEKDTIIYDKQYTYIKIISGMTCFGRVLNGIDLEGKTGSDKARLSIVSDSHNLQVYIFKQNQLKYLPDFLKVHMLAELLLVPEIDDIDLEIECQKHNDWESFKHKYLIETIEDNNAQRHQNIYKQT